MDKHMRRVNERENVPASLADTETALQSLAESFAGHKKNLAAALDRIASPVGA